MAVAAFVMLTGAVTFGILRATVGLRVPEQGETIGLDLYEHGLITYPEFTVGYSLPSAPKPGNPHAESVTEAVKTSPATGD